MNYLQLVNRARRECGVTGGDLVDLTTTVTTETQRFKDWVNEAWRDLQLHKPDWEWMRFPLSFPTVVGQAAYTRAQANAPTAADWRLDSFRAYRTSTGATDEQILPYMEYPTWRNVYQFGNMRTQTGRPVAITFTPDHTLSIGPLPDDIYTVVGEYYKAPADLVSATDDPSVLMNLPERFHMLIVYGAMKQFASFEAAAEVYSRAETEYRRLMNRLNFYGLPAIIDGPPLA